MNNKRPVGSFYGAVIFGAITAFFILSYYHAQGLPDGALTSAFALLLAVLSGFGFLVLFFIWVVKKRKYEKEKSHREMMARRKLERRKSQSEEAVT